MAEWSAMVCRGLAQTATLVVDTRDADHEAGDLLQAGVDVAALPTLGDVVGHSPGQTLGLVSGQTVFLKIAVGRVGIWPPPAVRSQGCWHSR
jgi:ornithine cyclodeaminase